MILNLLFGDRHSSPTARTPLLLFLTDADWAHLLLGVEYVYEYPFGQLDREAEMREAYARFEGMPQE